MVKTHLELIAELHFHESSYGYRPGKSCHHAVEKATQKVMINDWAIDLDIKGFLDSIDDELLLKADRHYCDDMWVLLHVTRWLKAGIVQKDGIYHDRETATPQGGVISPLLANIFLHAVFDQWMKIHHPEKSRLNAMPMTLWCIVKQKSRCCLY
ncbi:MAG: reverse transcriptase domain-containing protein [Ferruginibacter sp.]